MEQLKFVKISLQSVFQKAKWLAGLKLNRRYHELPMDALSDLRRNTGLNIKVMSFNIRRGTKQDGKNHWMYRRDLVNEIFSHYSPDVLGLQEALDLQISDIRAMLPGYAVVNIQSSGGNKILHNPVFYNAVRFALSEEGAFWYSDTPDIPGSKGWGNIMPRYCTWVRLIEKESGQAFYFYNTHLDHLSQRSRKKGVLLLTRRIAGRSYPDDFVLTGDFNAREKSVPIQFLKGKILLNTKAEGKVHNPDPLMDTFRVRYPTKRNASTFHGYLPFFFRVKLDYIFVSSAVRVQDSQIIVLRRKRCFPSDHFPLFSHINLPESLTSPNSSIPPDDTMTG